MAEPTNSQPSGDDFDEAMWQHMLVVNNAAKDKINELRRQVKALSAEVEKEQEARYSIQAQLCEAVEELERRNTVWPPYSIKEALRRGAKAPAPASQPVDGVQGGEG